MAYGAGRRGEKIGWAGGVAGGFLWVLVLGVIWLVQEHYLEGGIGLLLTAVALVFISLLAPWRHPSTPLWLLLAPVYLLLALAVVWSYGRWGASRQVVFPPGRS